MPPTSHDILARFERALSDQPDADEATRILSQQLHARRLVVVGPPPQVPFALEFTFRDRWFDIRLSGAPFASASENPPADRRYRVLGPPPRGALPAEEIIFQGISYADSARIESVLELISAATTISATGSTDVS